MRVRSKLGRLLEILPVEKSPFSCAQKATLQGICLFAEKGITDPSYGQLAVLCGTTSRTVQRTVRALELRGQLIVTERRSSAGYQLSNSYAITERGRSSLSTFASLGDLIEVAATRGANTTHISRGSVEGLVQQNAVTGCPTPMLLVSDVKQLQLTSKLSFEERASAQQMLAHLPINMAQQLADELRQRIIKGGVRSPLGYLSKLITTAEEGRFHPILASHGAKARQDLSSDQDSPSSTGAGLQ